MSQPQHAAESETESAPRFSFEGSSYVTLVFGAILLPLGLLMEFHFLPRTSEAATASVYEFLGFLFILAGPFLMAVGTLFAVSDLVNYLVKVRIYTKSNL